MARWDYKLDGGTYTEATDETIVDLLVKGRLQGRDTVAKAGTGQWLPVERTVLWSEHNRRKALADRNRPIFPKPGRARGSELYFLWFIITIVSSVSVWNAAESYNPEGNGMFSLVEASLLNNAWLKVVAALLSATFTSVFFAAVLIASRVRASTLLAREGYIAMIEELRLTREAIERSTETTSLNRDA